MRHNKSTIGTLTRKACYLSLSLSLVSGAIAMDVSMASAADGEIVRKRTVIQQTSKVEKKSPGEEQGSSAEISGRARSVTESKGTVITEEQYTKGVGFKNSNKVEFKYKERIENYEKQLKTGLEKGWINKDESEAFQRRIDEMKKTEADLSARNFPKEETSKFEKVVTKYNQDFSTAASTPADKKKSKKQ